MGKVLKSLVLGGVFTAVAVVLMMWLAGRFEPKVPADGGSPVTPARPVGDARLVEARLIEVSRTESAVGTVRAVHQMEVASRILAAVTEINVRAGQSVKAGDVLVRLDDADLRARLQQANAALESSRSARDQAQIDYDRAAQLLKDDVISRSEYDRARTALDVAAAEVERATRLAEESTTVLDYATIRAPADAVVVDKRVEGGDMVRPGQVVVSMYDPTRMQLVAQVREALAQRLAVGEMVDIRIEALDKQCSGRIAEIVPESEAASRAFSVKVTGPCPPGVHSGMFGRMLIPLDRAQVLVVPRAAIRAVGQLTLADVAHDGALQRRFVRLGEAHGDDVEVLSGLRPGEQVALPAGS